MPVGANPSGYNSLWQVRNDAWSSLEEAAAQLVLAGAKQHPVDSYCEYLTAEEVEQRVENGDQVVSTTYVTPYPPGYPVLVPGQVFSPQILAFMRSLDTPEVHGFRPDLGYRVYLDKALEIAATIRPASPHTTPE